ncbi:MAG TPA: dihydrofolate reductase family protein [Solirubrobacteraceae bacterium]|nr:dihydrofolate reductase family protein [Solirubrobacteraceae bacterium]
MPASPASGQDPELHRLVPDREGVSALQLLSSLNLAGLAHPDRPYTIANFVSSADGRAAFQGRSRDLSDPGDRQMFHGLREHVDAILVGTGTLRAERYGRLIRDPARRQRRAASGLGPEPLGVIFTRSGAVPTDIPLFDEPAARVVTFTPAPLDASGLAAQVEVVLLDAGQLTLTTMMRRLRTAYDVRSVLCEGGPTLFAALLEEGLVDELFLSLAPKLTGGGMAPSITTGPALPELRPLSLIWAAELHSSLYLRYAIH